MILDKKWVLCNELYKNFFFFVFFFKRVCWTIDLHCAVYTYWLINLGVHYMKLYASVTVKYIAIFCVLKSNSVNWISWNEFLFYCSSFSVMPGVFKLFMPGKCSDQKLFLAAGVFVLRAKERLHSYNPPLNSLELKTCCVL